MGLRNMVVHRGRTDRIGQFVSRLPVIYGADGQPVLRTRVVNHLPRDPQRSDVEVFLDPGHVVGPHGRRRTNARRSPRLHASAYRYTGRKAAAFLGLAEKNGRRGWRSPSNQSAGGVSTETVGFAGYAQEHMALIPRLFTTHPAVVSRLRAAALDDASRPHGPALTSTRHGRRAQRSCCRPDHPDRSGRLFTASQAVRPFSSEASTWRTSSRNFI